MPDMSAMTGASSYPPAIVNYRDRKAARGGSFERPNYPGQGSASRHRLSVMTSWCSAQQFYRREVPQGCAGFARLTK